MKHQLLSIAGHMLDRLSKPFRWQFYSECVSGDEVTQLSHDVPCGPEASRTCADICAPVTSITECNKFDWAHRLPVSISIRSYNVADGSLRPDELHMKFSSVTHRHGMRCATFVAAFMVSLDWINMDFTRYTARLEKGFGLLHPVEEALTEEQKLIKEYKSVTHNPRLDSFSWALVVSFKHFRS